MKKTHTNLKNSRDVIWLDVAAVELSTLAKMSHSQNGRKELAGHVGDRRFQLPCYYNRHASSHHTSKYCTYYKIAY